jgi:hypothetical protein
MIVVINTDSRPDIHASVSLVDSWLLDLTKQYSPIGISTTETGKEKLGLDPPSRSIGIINRNESIPIRTL